MSAFEALKAAVVAQVEALYAQDPVRFARLYAAFGDHGDAPPWPTVLLGTSGSAELRALLGSAWSPPLDPQDPTQGPDPEQIDHSAIAEILRAIGAYLDGLGETFQALDAKGQPEGYASLDATGKVPPEQLPEPTTAPAAYASTRLASDATGPAPFAGAVEQVVTPQGVTFLGTSGAWVVDAAGVYELSAALAVEANEPTALSVALGSHTVSGLAVSAERRTVSVSALVALAAEAEVGLTLTPEGSATVTTGAGSTVTIRRVA